MRLRECLTASAASLAAMLAVSPTAKAADADQPIATAQATVAPLTITAERRTINLQTAPIAASVLAGGQLQARGIEGLDDLQFHTPSLTVADFGQGNLFNIRGIGKDLTNVQTPSGVVTYWDGVASFPGFFTAKRPLRYFQKSWALFRFGGWLKNEAQRGRFHYLPRTAVVAKLRKAGFADVQRRRSFAGQAYIFRCFKPR